MYFHEINHSFNSTVLCGHILSPSDYILVDNENRIFRNNQLINFKAHLKLPIIRIFSNTHFILIERESKYQNDNAWIIHNNGNIENSFYLDNVMNISLTDNYIVTSYSECYLETDRVFTSKISNNVHKKPDRTPYCSEGFCLFDYQGNCIFKYMSDTEENNFIPIMETDCLLTGNNGKVYFLSVLFSGYHAILEFDLQKHSMKEIFNFKDIQKDNFIPKAITKNKNIWYIMMIDSNEMKKGDLDNFKSYLFKITTNKQLDLIDECVFSTNIVGNHNGSFSVLSGLKDKNSYFIQL